MALLYSDHMDERAYFRRTETLLIVAHSYGGYIEDSGFRSFEGNGKIVRVKYLTVPSATYATFLNNEEYWNRMRDHRPDYVLCIIAGNVVGSHLTRDQQKDQCKDFYQRLRDTLPDTTIIAAQAELRWYIEDNRFNAPEIVQYKRDRNCFNRFLDRSMHCKDYTFMVGGKNRLDKKEYYTRERDGRVHMNEAGIEEYTRQIMSMINFVQLHIIDTYLLTQREQIKSWTLLRAFHRLDQKCRRGRRQHPYQRQ